MGDRETNQEFEVRNILIGHCGDTLTPDMIVRIVSEITKAMQSGPCTWAFSDKSAMATRLEKERCLNAVEAAWEDHINKEARYFGNGTPFGLLSNIKARIEAGE